MGLGDLMQGYQDQQDAKLYRACNEYALMLVKSLAKRFPAVPTWQPLDDLLGKLTQIDNMTAKLANGYGHETEGKQP
jgi:hypothetical protein